MANAEWLGVLNTLAGTKNLGENEVANYLAYGSNHQNGMLKALNDAAATNNLGVNAVCNILANTKGLEALQALNILAGEGMLISALTPSGDTSGVADTAAINASLIANGHTILAAGQWYIGAPGMVNNSRWLQGVGPATVLNVVANAAGLTLTGPGDVQVSDMSFNIGSGAYAMTVNGAYDASFTNLYLTGTSAAGGITINGDLALEQNWTNVVGRTVGGKGFQMTWTGAGNTGSCYLTNVRFVTPPAGAYGLYLTSSYATPSQNAISLVDCVFDAYQEDAAYINNVNQVFSTGSWFAVGSNAAAGSSSIHILGGTYQTTFSNTYTYNGLASGGYCVKIAGSAYGININNHIFNGVAGTTALGLAGVGSNAGAGGLNLGEFQNYCGILTDTPAALVQPQPLFPGNAGMLGGNVGEEILPRWTVGNNAFALTSGLLVLTYFTAAKTETIGHIECSTGGAAASNWTYGGMGIFTVSSAGLLTLVAKGENTSTLWGSEYSYPGANVGATKVALTAGYTKVAGQTYAVGALYVGSTVPQICATILTSGGGGLAVASTPLGMISAQLAAQTTLGTIGTTTHTQASLASCSYAPYFILEA
jgi:hypothetical protein